MREAGGGATSADTFNNEASLIKLPRSRLAVRGHGGLAFAGGIIETANRIIGFGKEFAFDGPTSIKQITSHFLHPPFRTGLSFPQEDTGFPLRLCASCPAWDRGSLDWRQALYMCYMQSQVHNKISSESPMSHSLLRAAHEVVQALHQEHVHSAYLSESLLYLLIPYIVLIIVAVLYLKHATNQLYSISISPSSGQQMAIVGAAIVILGGIGFYAAIDHAWGSNAWIFYAVAVLLLAAFLLVHQAGKGFSLIVSSILMTAFAIVMYWHFREIAHFHHGGALILFFAGAVEAFGFIWALYVLGQVMVHECGSGPKSQTLCFFITALVVLGVVCFWHIHLHTSGPGLIGFLVTGVCLVILMFMRNQNSLF